MFQFSCIAGLLFFFDNLRPKG